MKLNATQLRANIYALLDQTLETGEPLIVERKGRRLVLTPERPAGKLAALKPRPGVLIGDPETLVHCDWSAEWRP